MTANAWRAAEDGAQTRALDVVARLFENGVDGVAVFDADLDCLYWGPVLERLTGLASAQAVGRRADEVLPVLWNAGHDADLRAALAGTPTASARPLAVSDRPGAVDVHDAYYWPLGNGGAVLVVRDRLAHREIVQQLGETDARFRRMADSSPVLLWMAGPDGRCEFFNQTWLDFTGRTMEQEVGYGWAEGVHFEDFSRCVDTYMAAFAARRPFEMEYRLRRADGEWRWLLDRGAPRFMPDGEFAGYIGSCVDITDRRAAEDELRRTTDRLGRANADLERFAYIASHDLRAPLRAIDALASMVDEDLADGDPDVAALRDNLAVMHGRIGRMEQMLQALLHYAVAGHGGEAPEPVDLGALLDDIAATVRAATTTRAVIFDVPAGLPVLETARVPLEHVLANLINNAAKHHDGPEARVSFACVEVGDRVEMTVTDDGPGIPEPLHHKAFQIFQTLRRRDEVEGSGLGLALVKKLVEMSGGTVQLHSPLAEGRGTTVRFTWPRRWPRSR